MASTLEEALEIIALESKTFWRPVTPNTIFVATDNPAKRKEIEQSVIKTFYLSNLSQPTELQDVVNAIRAVLDVQRMQQLPSQNALVVRGTPDQIALAEKLVDDLDKAARKSSWTSPSCRSAKDRRALWSIRRPAPRSRCKAISTNHHDSGPRISNGTTIQHRHWQHQRHQPEHSRQPERHRLPGHHSVRQSVGSMSNSDTKLIQNPQIRALDGQKASLKIGDRVPVATGSFQPGIGGVGINPLVNTQFQYLDVGVNIDITPHVHANGEVTLKI